MRSEYRLATLIIEEIERKRISFDKGFLKALEKFSWRVNKPLAYKIAWKSLTSFMLADHLLVINNLGETPLRRKCAFRVAFYLIFRERRRLEEIRRFFGGLLTGRMFSILKNVEKAEKAEELIDIEDKATFLALKYSHPIWLVEELLKVMSPQEVEKMLKSNERPVKWLRLNKFKKIKYGQVIKRLRKSGLTFQADSHLDGVFEVRDIKSSIGALPLVEKGILIPQDKGSVLAVHALGPERGDEIYDACAAPGLKTEYIYELTEGRVHIIAGDLSINRAFEMKKILHKLIEKPVNIDIIILDASKMIIKRDLDKILIDAPCTNSGAIAQDPALRIILQDKKFLYEVVRVQWNILSHIVDAIDFNSLVYSVCSLLPHEGEAHVLKLVKEKGLEVEDVRIPGEGGYTVYGEKYGKVRRLFPHRHRSTGFFIARLVKTRGKLSRLSKYSP
ncbi:MAG: RsmB/NOP family class I SAM-dependent RNA methyltransferase [Thermoproteales archaeon]|nr:RsmB/NOP family class I SAM-dependent RNA methyltransferase [Thermoproteales archaeon]RLE65634.1 MAG: hypothetical protein DRJ47_04690 [Thermoprotei archaeon]